MLSWLCRLQTCRCWRLDMFADLQTKSFVCALQRGAQGMDATDRAVAIRTLIVSTAREAPEVALESALKEILRSRRATAQSGGGLVRWETIV